MNKTTTKYIVFLILGICIGFGIGVNFIKSKMHRPKSINPNTVLNHLNDVLKLEDSQKVQIEPIVKIHLKRMSEVFPLIEKEIDLFEADVRKHLTKDQQVLLKKIRANRPKPWKVIPPN